MQISQDQVELKDLVRRFFAERVTSEYLRKRIKDGVRHDAEFLKGFSELGLEEGFAGDDALFSFVELALIAEEAGRVLLPEPLIERVFATQLLPKLLPHGERGRYQAALSPRAAIGATIGFAPATCCELSRSEGGKLSGRVMWGFGVEGAAKLIAFVRADGERVLALIDLVDANVRVVATDSLDLTLALSSTVLQEVGAVEFAGESAIIAEDCLEILKASEVFGICERVVEMTCEYVRTREQFGVPVGGFQAIQHRLADLHAQTEALGALCRFAAWAVEHAPEQRSLTARAASMQAAVVGPQVCESALQCHGGIGFTWEYDLHLYLRRTKLLEAAFCSSDMRADELLERARGR